MKKLDLNFHSVEGNAMTLLALFRMEAKRAGWDKKEIESVCEEAMSGDYDHLLQTLMNT